MLGSGMNPTRVGSEGLTQGRKERPWFLGCKHIPCPNKTTVSVAVPPIPPPSTWLFSTTTAFASNTSVGLVLNCQLDILFPTWEKNLR